MIEWILACCYYYFKMRCARDLCTSQGRVRARKLLPCEKVYFDRIEEVVHRDKLGDGEPVDKLPVSEQSSACGMDVEDQGIGNQSCVRIDEEEFDGFVIVPPVHQSYL